MRINAAVVDNRRKLSVYRGMTFGDWLRRNIKEAGLSNAELARRVGVSSTHISNLVRDFSPSRKAPGPSRPGEDLVKAIARALNADHDEARLAAGYAPLSQTQSFNIGEKARIALLDQDLTEDEQREIVEEMALAYEVIMARRQRNRNTQ